MASKNIEIELKFPLKNPEDVAKFLEENANLQAKDIFQKDSYFIPKHRDFLQVKFPFEWLRIRESHRGTSLNYKHFYPENAEKSDYCDEFETKIDDINAVRKILESLDFKEVCVVIKTRTIWIFQDVEIAIDIVKNLGSFIELEATTHFENPRDGKEFLYGIMKNINAQVGDVDERGYPFRILEKQGYKFGIG